MLARQHNTTYRLCSCCSRVLILCLPLRLHYNKRAERANLFANVRDSVGG